MKKIGDVIELQKQDVEVVKCDKCEALMVNVKPDQVIPGDLVTLKRLGLRLTNPNTKDQICISCEVDREEKEFSVKRKIKNFFDSDEDTPSHRNDSGLFGGFGSGGHSDSGGGFGGFGGGIFSGGGATGSF
jgi:uncharacterized membrane protein YgcG